MEKFLKELEVGEIHFRDRWQFELKSDFTPVQEEHTNVYTQEFYFFIPKSLQVNNLTYPKELFYRDQTNWIRYKTPVMTLEGLADPNNASSPLYRVKKCLGNEVSAGIAVEIEDDLKLFGNIVRSAIRKRIATIIHILDAEEDEREGNVAETIGILCEDVRLLHAYYRGLKDPLFSRSQILSTQKCYGYVDEFISQTIEYYCLGLLAKIRHYQDPLLQEADHKLCRLIADEKRYRISEHDEQEVLDENGVNKEFILYRRGLLSKYVMDALLLSLNRSYLGSYFQNITGMIAAGIAMLFYMVLFVWQGQMFLINSTPFVVVTVLLYILKDRLKEGIKSLSAQHAFRWFPDYRIAIMSADNREVLGKLEESVSFISEESLPLTIKRIRNKEFHQMVTFFERPEDVIYYKKKMFIIGEQFLDQSRRYGLNTIFRFNIQRFLSKASNPTQSYLTLVPKTERLTTILLPKIYHMNMIMKNTYMGEKGKVVTEYKKFRLVVDKNGIRQVERVYLTDPSK